MCSGVGVGVGVGGRDEASCVFFAVVVSGDAFSFPSSVATRIASTCRRRTRARDVARASAASCRAPA